MQLAATLMAREDHVRNCCHALRDWPLIPLRSDVSLTMTSLHTVLPGTRGMGLAEEVVDALEFFGLPVLLPGGVHDQVYAASCIHNNPDAAPDDNEVAELTVVEICKKLTAAYALGLLRTDEVVHADEHATHADVLLAFFMTNCDQLQDATVNTNVIRELQIFRAFGGSNYVACSTDAYTFSFKGFPHGISRLSASCVMCTFS